MAPHGAAVDVIAIVPRGDISDDRQTRFVAVGIVGFERPKRWKRSCEPSVKVAVSTD
jgi:hypothetical protein